MVIFHCHVSLVEGNWPNIFQLFRKKLHLMDPSIPPFRRYTLAPKNCTLFGAKTKQWILGSIGTFLLILPDRKTEKS